MQKTTEEWGLVGFQATHAVARTSSRAIADKMKILNDKR